MITGIAYILSVWRSHIANLVWDRRPQNRSATQQRGMVRPSNCAYISLYTDRTTQFSCTGSNPANPAVDIQKNSGTKRGWPYSI